MKSKQIDVVVKYFHPVAAGIETNILNTYSVLAQMGWDVRIHTSTNTHTGKDILPKFEIIRGLKVYRYKHHWYGIQPNIDYTKTSLVCIHNFNIFPHIQIMTKAILGNLTKTKKYGLVLTPHGGYTPDWNVFGPISKQIKKIYHRTLGKILINLSCDAIRAVSVWEKDQIISQGVNKDIIQVITNGVENEAFVDLNKEASKQVKNLAHSLGDYIIQVGRIYPIKNYETTIRALSLIPGNLKYAITGADSEKSGYFNSLKKLIKSLGLEERVVFTGVISGVDKFYLMNKAQMMVHMAHWESFCNVVHEGMSQGLVCIVANNTALPYLIKNNVNGYCVETFDYKSLASKIEYVIKNKNKKEIIQIEKNNKNIGSQETWGAVAEKMNNLYLKLI